MIVHDLSGISSKLAGALKKNKYVLLVLLAGIILLILPSTGGSGESESDAAEDVLRMDFSLSEIERRLQDILADISGAGDVRVMLSVQNSGERILASDSQTSQSTSGGDEDGEKDREENQTSVVISKGSGIDDVVTLQYVYPEFTGAVIVAEGADSASVRLDLTEAVQAVTGLDSSQIKVVKMK